MSKNLTHSSALFLALCVGTSLTAPSPVLAAESERSAPPKPETRRVETLTQATFDKLTRAQEMIGSNQHAGALSILNGLLQSDRINPYEQAVVQQTIGFCHADKGDYARAVAAFEAALSLQKLPEQAALDIKYNLGQLYLGLDQAGKAIRWLEEWKVSVPSLNARAYALLAQAYAQAERFDEAIPYAERAVNSQETPRESWYQLLISLYLEKGTYSKALPVVEQATRLFPGKAIYWTQLVGLYSELNDQRRAFATMRAMHRQNMLTKSSELVRLAQMFLYFEAPYQAGKVISEGLAAQSVENTAKNWELLADAWVMAREWERAQPALARAAALSGDGNTYMRLGHAYIEDEAWRDAETALAKAVGADSLRDRGQAWLLLGIARAKQSKYASAQNAFTEALSYSTVKAQAETWLGTVTARLAATDSSVE